MGLEEAVILAVNVLRARCDMCGRRLTRRSLGYVRLRRGRRWRVELALCAACLRDLEEWYNGLGRAEEA